MALGVNSIDDLSRGMLSTMFCGRSSLCAGDENGHALFSLLQPLRSTRTSKAIFTRGRFISSTALIRPAGPAANTHPFLPLFRHCGKEHTERRLKRRVDFWPFYTFHRDMDGNRRLQVLAPLEPFFPTTAA